MSVSIDRDGRTPLYYQIHDLLLAQIEESSLRPGDRIPSEAELSERYRVSRITVKQAIQKLVQSGHLYRQQGKGTFVAQPPVPKRLAGVISFSEEMRQRGRTPTTRLLEVRVLLPEPAVRAAMGLAPGREVVRLRRLRLADGQVMGIQTAHLPYDLCPELADPELIAGRSLYEVLEARYGWRPSRALEEYRVVPLSAAEARLLEQPDGAPAFGVKRWSYLADGRLVEYVESLLRADRYTLQIELTEAASRPPGASQGSLAEGGAAR